MPGVKPRKVEFDLLFFCKNEKATAGVSHFCEKGGAFCRETSSHDVLKHAQDDGETAASVLVCVVPNATVATTTVCSAPRVDTAALPPLHAKKEQPATLAHFSLF